MLVSDLIHASVAERFLILALDRGIQGSIPILVLDRGIQGSIPGG